MNFANRLLKLSHLLPSLSTDGLLIEHPADLLYLTGLQLSAGKLLVTESSALLVVDGRYLELCQQKSPCPVHKLEEDILQQWIKTNSIDSLAVDGNKMSYQAFSQLQQITSSLKVALLAADSPVQTLRLIKDQDEIETLRQSARLNAEGLAWIIPHIKEGVTEQELALELEFFWKKRGAKTLAFEPIIAFGSNGSMPHYRAGKTSLEFGMPILIDIGVTWQHYQSDMTRVLFFGSPPAEIEAIYKVVEEAKQKALQQCRPGTLIGQLDQAARQHILKQGYGNFFVHSLGHGVGLDTHEPPILRSKGPFTDQPLKSGMVITIEPGIYLPKKGGVRLEDTIVITEEGHENLTAQSLATIGLSSKIIKNLI
jgi:Xaa-Pro aminopeptidase